LVIIAVTSVSARADPPRPLQRLRLTDARLRRILDEGRDQSPLFRSLVDRLEASDVVVYVQCARLRTHLDGELLFLTAAGGVRYVLVRIAWDVPPPRKIAILGHELQHALEIAGSPDIVSAQTMAAAYKRFGFTRNRSGEQLDFDTTAAIATGLTVWRELSARDDGE
jgi:hypothetical protein